MLQIATGKLFYRGILHENHLSGVLYSNAMRIFGDGIVTKAGTIRSTSLLTRTPSLIFEMIERIEGDEIRAGVIQSYGINRYLSQFAALMSFFLGITCNPDNDLVKRLTSGQRGLGISAAPKELINRVFDPEVSIDTRIANDFAEFIEKLLSLDRKSFLGATRAIHTFMNGLHRMSDDLETAYTLMVASLEALAIEFDGHETKWEDVENAKRTSIEKALKDAPPDISASVKAAIVTHEHVLARRRFKEFVLTHLPADFFLEAAQEQTAPLGRADLADALDFAYEIRSKYVHELKLLPDILCTGTAFSEHVSTIDHRTAVTFQGIYRVARSVILEFIQRQPSIEKEPYNYSFETGGVIRARMGAVYWMRPEIVTSKNCKLLFEGFLETICNAMLQNGESVIPDMKAILDKTVHLLPSMDKQNRRAYVALVAAVRITTPKTFHATDDENILNKWSHLFDNLSPETLILFMLMGKRISAPIEEHKTELLKHIKFRTKPSGFRVPRHFEAQMMLELCERYRREATWEEAYSMLIQTCENFPEFGDLRSLALRAHPSLDLIQENVLLPPAKNT